MYVFTSGKFLVNFRGKFKKIKEKGNFNKCDILVSIEPAWALGWFSKQDLNPGGAYIGQNHSVLRWMMGFLAELRTVQAVSDPGATRG